MVGTIEGQTSRKIGDYDYQFAIVEVEGSYLWQKLAQVRQPAYYSHYYWYHDPWYHHHYHPHFYY